MEQSGIDTSPIVNWHGDSLSFRAWRAGKDHYTRNKTDLLYASSPSALPFELFAQTCFRRTQRTGRVGRCEVLGFKHRANLDLSVLVVGIGAALDPSDRLLHGLHLPEPETGKQLFRLGERPVDDHAARSGEPNALALRAG